MTQPKKEKKAADVRAAAQSKALKRYLATERRVAKVAGLDVIERWRSGHQMLADPEIVNSAGSLRRGRGLVEMLIAAAQAEGLSPYPQEFRRRLQCAKAYATEAQVVFAQTTYGHWTALIAHGFPPVEVPEEALAEPESEPVQGSLDEEIPDRFKVDGQLRPRALTPLDVILAYAAERKCKNKSAAQRDEFIQAELEELVDAVGGDLSVTYGEAVARRQGREAAG